MLELTTSIVLASAILCWLVFGVTRLSQRSSDVKRAGELLFHGRDCLDSRRFASLFTHELQDVAQRVHILLSQVLIVDVNYILPEDKLISELRLGTLDGLEAYDLGARIKEEFSVDVLGLLEADSDPSIKELIEYLAKQDRRTKR